MWVGLVDPRFTSEVLSFYTGLKSQQQIVLSVALANYLKIESGKSFPFTMHAIERLDHYQKILNILSMFVLKRPDISYHSGMNHIVALLLSVFNSESDVFVMFCHIIENVFPRVLCN